MTLKHRGSQQTGQDMVEKTQPIFTEGELDKPIGSPKNTKPIVYNNQTNNSSCAYPKKGEEE